MTASALFLVVWFLGTFAGTAFAILVVHVGSTRCAPDPSQAPREDREWAA